MLFFQGHIVRIDCGLPDLTCLICHERCTKLHYLRMHMVKHDRKYVFDCEFCGIVFDSHEELAEHKVQHLSLPNYTCLWCDYIGKTTQLLKQHVKTHVSSIPSDCTNGKHSEKFIFNRFRQRSIPIKYIITDSCARILWTWENTKQVRKS